MTCCGSYGYNNYRRDCLREIGTFEEGSKTMTLSIELTPEISARLQAEATAQGINATELACRLIEQALPAKTIGEQILEEWEHAGVRGVFADRPDSPEFARELRRRAETRGSDAETRGADAA